MAQPNKTSTELMRTRVQNVITWSKIFALSDPDDSIYITLPLLKDTNIDVHRYLELSAAGP